MFDIGFFELIVIGIIALLVLGPERLPHAVRMAGAWIGKIRRATQAVRDELEREVNAQELQQRLKEEMEKSGLNEAKASFDELQTAMQKNLLDQPRQGVDSTATPAGHEAANAVDAQPAAPANNQPERNQAPDHSAHTAQSNATHTTTAEVERHETRQS